MKNYFLLVLLKFFFVNCEKVYAQDLSVTDSTYFEKTKLDVKANVGLVILTLYTGGWIVGYTGHRYFVNDKPYLGSKKLSSYLINSKNELILKNSKQFENSKKISTILGGVGLVVYTFGFVQLLNQIITPKSQITNNFQGPILLGTGLIIAAPIIKLNGISKLKRAIRIYNNN